MTQNDPERWARRRRWRLPLVPLIAAVVAWAGLLVFMYPSAAAWVSQLNQSALVDSYTEKVEAGVSPTAAKQLAAARAYNKALNSGASLEAGHRLPTGMGSSTDPKLNYWNLLRATPLDVMARLRIASIDLDLPVYHGTSDDTLERGVGHLEGTSLPVGGIGTHAVLTAHRGLATATLFTHLDKVEVGDAITIEVMDEVLKYRVVSSIVVDPDQTESLRADPAKDLITLVTCTPLGINSQRILVTAERVTPTPQSDIDAAHRRPDVPGFPWWIVIVSGGFVAAAGYVYWSGRPSTSGPSPGRRGMRRTHRQRRH